MTLPAATLEAAPATPSLADCPRCRFTLAPRDERPLVDSPEAAFAVFGDELSFRDREHCVALMLDTKHRLIAQALCSVGTIDHTFMSPREILRDALLANASAIVLGHNHPSGDPEPSRDDERVTRRISEAAATIGVEILDHLVVGGGDWVSMARRGAL